MRLRLQVGQRIISSERRLHEYSTDLESLVRKQTITLKETQEEIVSRLFSALASRDQETALHVLRIGTMCAYMGQLMGWNPQQIDTLKAAAPLHDIGKIGISDTLLLKPGILTKAEFMQIQQHTTIGAQILSGSRNATIQMGSSIARYHHENWDGSGYPEGLRGDQIPVEAQLVSIVDVYDAMLSDRIYRKAMPEEQVLKYIKDQSRCKFAPKLAKMFLENHAYIKEQCDKDLSRITVPGL